MMAKLVISETCNCSHTHQTWSGYIWSESGPFRAIRRRLSELCRCLFLVAIGAVPDSYERGERDYSWPNREIIPLLNNEGPRKQPERENPSVHTGTL